MQIKLNDFNSIDMWKEIANKVQKLSINECSNEEFLYNLRILKELLSNINIDLSENLKNLEIETQIGLATLLQSIYSIDTDINYKKAKFYEKIYQLSDLNVKKIKFKPVDFEDKIFNLYRYIGETNKIQKAYTDGVFMPLQDRYTW